MSTWVVGDVHGCAAELGELLERIGPGTGDRVVLLGDLLDKGPDPAGVMRLREQLHATGVLGNHDVAVRELGRARLEGREPRGRAPAPYLVACLDTLERAGLLEEAVSLCSSLPLFEEAAGFLVVHAGLHPLLGTAGTDERMATTLREFPPGAPGAQKWWKQWRGPQGVIFGHDARQGLVHHVVDGRPLAVGLDTGCVYGGKLTAYCVEEDRFEQVASRAEWHAKGHH